MSEDFAGQPLDSPSSAFSEGEAKPSWPIAVVVTLVAAGIAGVASLLPWASVLVFSVAGTDSVNGKVTLFAAAAAITLLIVGSRRRLLERRLTWIATACLFVVAGVYVYVGCQMSAAFTDSDAKEFSGWISRGFGLEIGIVSSVVAFAMVLTLLQHVRSGASLLTPSPVWGQREVGVFATATAALSLLTFYDVFFVPLIGGLIAGGIWFLLKRSQPLTGHVGRIVLVVVCVTVGGAVVEGVAFGLDNDSEPADLWNFESDDDSGDSTPDTSNSSDFGADTSEVDAFVDPSDRPCEDVFSEAETTDDAREIYGCQRGDETVFILSETVSCVNDSMLVYNEYGWGKAGAKWNSSASATPALGECQGLAGDRCRDAFAVGVTTNESWEGMFADISCVDDNGKVVEVGSSYSTPCFDSDKSWITNDYGWGFIGEPWQAGDGPDGC